MGVYNCDNEAVIARCMKSIINQTYTDWEFIVCDDGSDTGSFLKLKKWEMADKRIRIIRNSTNRTLAPTLNRCIRLAKGAYIARMDIDDWAEPERFKTQLAYLEENKELAFCGADVMLFDDSGVWGVRSHPEHPQNEDFLMSVPFVHPTIMARRSFYEKYTYCEDKLYYRCEDYELFARAYSNGERGANIHKPLLHYNENRKLGKKMTFSHRIRAVKVRAILFAKMHLFPRAVWYIWKPLISGLIPRKVIRIIKREDL
jgi:glycosyltransferase involved in cell wall biosynthesis